MKTLLLLGVGAALLAGACGSPVPIESERPPSPIATRPPQSPQTIPPTPMPSALPTFPTAPPLPGRIAYNTDDHAIWIMNADGSDQYRVSNPGRDGNDFDPRWSPDGRFVTFRSSRGVYAPDTYTTGTEGIWILDVITGREQQLFPPDAQTIGGLFAAPGPNGLIALSTVDTIAGEPQELITLVDRTGKRLKTFDVDGSGECSLWSPDGSRIAYCHHGGGFFSSDGRFAVWVMDADGSDRHKLSDSPGSADPDAWSPDGGRLVYDSGAEGSRHVYITDEDGRHQKQLTSMPGTQAAVAWLPNGRIIVKWSPSDTSAPRWLVMNANGSEIAEITTFERAGVTALVWHE